MKLVRPLVPAGRLELRRSPNRGGRTAVSVYRPMRLKGRVLAAATRLSIPKLSVVDATDDQEQLIRLVVPQDAEGYCVMRSSEPTRWIVAVSRAGSLSEVAKVGLVTDRGLENEATMLRELGRPGGVHLPELVRHSIADGRRILVTRALPGSPRRDLCIATAVAIALADLGVTHGDLTPWNLIGEGPTLFDWESSEWSLRPMHDLCHFVVQREALLGRGRVAPVLRALMSRGGAGETYLRSRGRPLDDAARLLRTYLDEVDRRGIFMASAPLRVRVREAIS